jgi:O-antigen ligase
MNEIASHRLLFADRIILFLLIPAIYFEANLPYYGTASTPFIFFALVVAYLVTTRMRSMFKLMLGKYFLASLFFVFVCIFMETIHSSPNYEYVLRYFNTSIGIYCIALLCRDKESLGVTIMSFILSSALQAIILIAGTMVFLRGFAAKGFVDASQIRIRAFDNFYLRGHPIDISLFCTIGALLGIIYFFYEQNRNKKFLLVSLTIPSIVGIFLPASRTGAIIFFTALIIFIFKSKIKIKRWLVPSLLLALLLLIAVPDVVWVRLFSIANFSELQQDDSRAKGYEAVLNSIDQYFLTGVGSGNYWNRWAVGAGITSIRETNVALAAHNAFLQIWMYWGLPALISFFILMYVYAKGLYTDLSDNTQKACIYIFIVTIPLIFLFYPSFYNKTFAVGIGMLVGARFWNIYTEKEETILPREKAVT